MINQGSRLESKYETIILQAIRQVSPKPIVELYRDQAISSLGLDSVTIMEMVGAIEEQLALQFSDEELAKVTHFGALADLIKLRAPTV